MRKEKIIKAWAICKGNKIHDNGFYLSIVKFNSGKKAVQQEIDKGGMDKDSKIKEIKILCPKK